MSTAIALVPTPHLEPLRLVESAERYVAAAKSERTRALYRQAFGAFSDWCASHNVDALPAKPGTVVLYVTDMADAGLKPATIALHVVAISQQHKAAGLDSPTKHPAVAETLKGIRRTLGTAQVQKAPLLAGDLRRIVAVLPATAKGVRDAALLLLGFAGAFRRSELVALDVGDLEFVGGDLLVHLRRSKVDQEARGRRVGVPRGSDPATCPVRAVQRWLGDRTSGPLFTGLRRGGAPTGKRLDGGDVANIVKAACESVGLDAAKFSGHSLRAGLVTSAIKAGATERSVMCQTGHKSLAMLHKYVRDAEALGDDNAARGLL